MSKTTFRIHPSIGFARVGTSEHYYLAPETLTGHPLTNSPDGAPPPEGANPALTGGLPIKQGTENTPITASDVRGVDGGLARQAARFRVYAYQSEDSERYPMGKAMAGSSVEICVGTEVEIAGQTKKVADIIWTVHVANKKTAWYGSADDDGILAWGTPDQPKTPTEGLRNEFLSANPEDPRRLRTLIIDPGPRTIAATSGETVGLDDAGTPSYYKPGAGVTTLRYPKNFPEQGIARLPKEFPDTDKYDGKVYPPGVSVIHTLGELQTDTRGRLIVIAAAGHANSFNNVGAQYGFTHAVNNDWWFDDTGDGPVDAVLVFEDGSSHKVEGAAWVISTDPSYAPQVLNVVSLWDDIYDSWVRDLGLRPDLYTGTKADGAFVSAYKPSFVDEVQPIFLAAGLQRWVTNLTSLGIAAHQRVEQIKQDTKVSDTALAGLGLIRKPVDPGEDYPEAQGDRKRMPLSLGDAGRSLMSLTKTQYHYLECWNDVEDRGSVGGRITLSHGELLDKASLLACLGGRFGPGIDMSYMAREADIWARDWQRSGAGPFRINPKPMDYQAYEEAFAAKAELLDPCLSIGWTPKRDQHQLEPGDVSKFMAIPWHADYNSCGTHLPAPNIEQNNQLYWSWPAQRPVAVYPAKDVRDGKGLVEQILDDDGNPIMTRERQRFSVRGDFTKTAPIDPANPPNFGPGNPAEVGRYQQTPKGEETKEPGVARILDHWMNIGVVIQACNIDDEGEYEAHHYLEVASKFEDQPSDDVQPWDMNRVPPGKFDA